jgi:hypothetical protein
VNGVLTADERHVVGAAHQLGLILSSDWPGVAAHLLAQGADGEAIVELAGRPRTTSPWVLDQLVPTLLSELAVPAWPIDEASELAGRLVGQAVDAGTGTDEFVRMTPVRLGIRIWSPRPSLAGLRS